MSRKVLELVRGRVVPEAVYRLMNQRVAATQRLARLTLLQVLRPAICLTRLLQMRVGGDQLERVETPEQGLRDGEERGVGRRLRLGKGVLSRHILSLLFELAADRFLVARFRVRVLETGEAT